MYVSLSGYKRDLSVRQAVSCEWALHPKCVCRCHGALHSAARFGAQLPPDLRQRLNEIMAMPDEKTRNVEITKLLKGAHADLLRKMYEEIPQDDAHHVSTEPERRDRSLYRKAHKMHTNEAIAAMTYAVGAYEVCPICLDEGRASPIQGDAEKPLIAAPVQP